MGFGEAPDDLDFDDDGVLDTTPWTAEWARLAIVEEDNPPSGTEFHYGPPQVGPNGTFAPSHAYFCEGEGWLIGSFDEFILDTPGAPNDCPMEGGDDMGFDVGFDAGFDSGFDGVNSLSSSKGSLRIW